LRTFQLRSHSIILLQFEGKLAFTANAECHCASF